MDNRDTEQFDNDMQQSADTASSDMQGAGQSDINASDRGSILDDISDNSADDSNKAVSDDMRADANEDMLNEGRRYRSEHGRSRADRGQNKRRLLIAIIAVIIVVDVIFFAVRASNKRKAAEAESIAASLAAEQETTEQSTGYEITEFEECSIPELNMLAQDYFDAKITGDTDKLAELFGRSAVDADAELAVRLKAQADWIQSYTLKKVYAAPGLDDKAKLCLVLYDIDFRRTDTLAPGVMYFYATRDDAGNYTIVENPVKEIHDYISAELETDSAKSLIDESNASLKEALDSDSTLSLIYVSFLSGDIYKESDLDVNRDQEVGFTAEDSVLVDDSVLADIENEAAEEASIEASLAAEDAKETQNSDTDSTEAAGTDAQGSETAGASGTDTAETLGADAQ